MTTSKFKGILQQAKDRTPESPADAPLSPPPAPLAPPSAKKRGRPSGKRSDADYTQITAYIQRETHRDVKIALLKSGNGLDFSELIDSLLAEWLKSNT